MAVKICEKNGKRRSSPYAGAGKYSLRDSFLPEEDQLIEQRDSSERPIGQRRFEEPLETPLTQRSRLPRVAHED